MIISLQRNLGLYGARLGVLVAMTAALLIVSSTFRSASSVFAVLEGFAFLGLVALGISFTMIAGEFDLSVGSMAALAGVVAIQTSFLGLVPAILIATAAGVGLGALQGFLIYRLRINSFIFTIGTLILLRGLAYVLSGDKPVVLTDFTLSDPMLVRWLFLSPSSVVAIALFVVAGLFLAYTRPGRELYAIGGARSEAVMSGVSLKKNLTSAFGISGGLAALAGAMACMRGGSATPEGFYELLLMAAAAALIGGISLYGGRGTIVNVILGVGIASVLAAGMAALAAPSYLRDFLLGLLLLVMMSVDFLMDRFTARRRIKRLRSTFTSTAPITQLR